MMVVMWMASAAAELQQMVVSGSERFSQQVKQGNVLGTFDIKLPSSYVYAEQVSSSESRQNFSPQPVTGGGQPQADQVEISYVEQAKIIKHKPIIELPKPPVPQPCPPCRAPIQSPKTEQSIYCPMNYQLSYLCAYLD